MSDTITQEELAEVIGYSQGRVSRVTGEEGLVLYPDFMDEPFDPDDCAVYNGGHFQGYAPSELPEPVRQRWEEQGFGDQASDVGEHEQPAGDTGSQEGHPTTTPRAARQIPNPAQVFLPTAALSAKYRSSGMAPRRSGMSLPSKSSTNEFLSGNEVRLQKEDTSVSVIPEGADVSRSVAYGSVGYVVETAVRQDPSLAWAGLGLAGLGLGAYTGYQIDGSAESTAAGAAVGLTGTLLSGLIGKAVTQRQGRQLVGRNTRRQGGRRQKRLVGQSSCS